MNRIVVPTDLSPKTDNALSVAVRLARTHKADIVLLHSVTYPMLTPVYDELLTSRTMAAFDDLEQHAHDALRAFTTNPAYTGVTIIPTLIKEGEGLVQDVIEQPADLIVMASRGASGLEEWLIGSNAEVIVRYAHCPVLVVKGPMPQFRPENIICAIDIDDRLKAVHQPPFQLGEQGLHQFLYVLTPTDNRDPTGVRDWVNEFASAKGITNFRLAIRSARTAPAGIVAYAEEVAADLIVLYTHGHTGWQHLFAGSVAEDVLNQADLPVLVMRV